MKFLVMVTMTPQIEANLKPTKEAFEKMGAFNETLTKDGVLLDMGGLHPTSKAVRIDYSGDKPRTIDGPFTESKEVVAGFWMLQARSKEEVVERLLHCPFELGENVEIRQMYEPEEVAELFK